MLSTSKETVLLRTAGTRQQSQDVQVFESGVDLVWVGDAVAALYVQTEVLVVGLGLVAVVADFNRRHYIGLQPAFIEYKYGIGSIPLQKEQKNPMEIAVGNRKDVVLADWKEEISLKAALA